MAKELEWNDLVIGRDLTMLLDDVLHVDGDNVIFFSPHSAKWRISTKKSYDQLKKFFSKQQLFSELGKIEKSKIVELWNDGMLKCSDQLYEHKAEKILPPCLLAIKLTDKCNYRCDYCYDFKEQPKKDKSVSLCSLKILGHRGP